MRLRIGPLGFLFAVVIGWSAVRSLALWMAREVPPAPEPRQIAWQVPLPEVDTRSRTMRFATVTRQAARPALHTLRPEAAERPNARGPDAAALHEEASPAVPLLRPASAQIAPLLQFSQPPSALVPHRSPSLSTWVLVRERAAGAGLAAAGQLGGSQAGARVRVPVAAGLAAALRVSGPIQQRLGKEAAIGLDWTFGAKLPATLLVERRVGLDRGGRDAWAAGVYGGVYGVRLGGLELDGYAQAGMVGAKRRDGFIDGTLRAERPLIRSGRASLGLGAGLWGGAQPGASRLDVGPQLVAHLPIGQASARLGLEYRARVAGGARPGSGLAMTLGADF